MGLLFQFMRFYAIFVHIFEPVVMQISAQQGLFQTPSPLPRNPVTINVHGDGNGAAADSSGARFPATHPERNLFVN
jgi:hypothetical protein